MSVTKLILNKGPKRALSGRLPAITDGDGRLEDNTTGTIGPFVAGGPLGQSLNFQTMPGNLSPQTPKPAQLVGAYMSIPAPVADINFNLPTAAEIVAYLGSQLCQPAVVGAFPILVGGSLAVNQLLPVFTLVLTVENAGVARNIKFTPGANGLAFDSGISKAATTDLNVICPISAAGALTTSARIGFVILNAIPGSESYAICRM